MSILRSLCAVPVMALFAVAAAAQQQPSQQPPQQQNQNSPQGPDGSQTQPPQVEVPKELIEQLLAGAPGAEAAARQFLTGGTRKPEVVTQRATALIRQLGANKAGAATDQLLKAVDRIASNAIGLVAGAQIVRVGIDKDFRPRNAVLAWDFGPADGAPPPGFEKVQPGDGRIGGAGLSALRRPADETILQDGITGVERIEADVPDGEYRIILMTQNLGDGQLMASPFGSEIVVNGAATPVGDQSPDAWVEDAVFSNRGLQNVATGGGSGSAQGFISGDLTGYDPAMFRRQQGGAIVLTAIARGGKLIIELKGFRNNARSYLTGLMVEPANRTSDLILSRRAVDALAPVEMRLALEEEILSSAASVLSQVDPADGDPELVELPEPILDPEENASVSS